MTILHGEYECRIDDKGRIILPAGLKKQLPPEAQQLLVQQARALEESCAAEAGLVKAESKE